MTNAIAIPAHTAGRIDVFNLDLAPDEANAFMRRDGSTDDPNAAWPLRAALGADYLAPTGVELVDLDDLSGLGLAGYLRDGLGATEADVALHKDVLDALSGLVVVVRGVAYGAMEQTLAPKAPLSHVATLHEAQAAPPGPPLTADSAEPSVPEPQGEEPAEPDAPQGHGSPLPVILGGLVAAAVLVVLLSLAFGG